MESNYISQKNHIQQLAKQLAEISAGEENTRKRQLWADHNDLARRTKPPVWVCPDDDGGWLELIDQDSLFCADPELRKLELILTKYLYQHRHIPDDFVFEPRVYINYPGQYSGYMYGDPSQKTAWGLKVDKPTVGKNAYHLENVLTSDEAYETLLAHEVDFVPDEAEKQRLAQKYGEVLEGLLEVEFQLPYSVLVQSHLIELVHLRGLEEMMYDLYDGPELLYDVLRHMGESKARLLQKLEKEKLLFDNRINIYTGSGSLGYTNAPRKKPQDVLLKDMWGFADAQEFSNVSPEMFEHFALENQRLGLVMFGRACYGCCEPLDGKYDAIKRNIPNIHRYSVSPWADLKQAAEKIGKNGIFSWKPNPVLICSGFDEAEVYKSLCNVAEITRDCFVEIILKDIRTCGGTNSHLVKFTQLANKAFDIS